MQALVPNSQSASANYTLISHYKSTSYHNGVFGSHLGLPFEHEGVLVAVVDVVGVVDDGGGGHGVG